VSSNYTKLPDMWKLVLRERGATAAEYDIAWELLSLARFSPVFKFSNVRAQQMGHSPATRWRALEHFTKWGLLKKVKIGRRKSPMLRVDWLAGRQPGGHIGNG